MFVSIQELELRKVHFELDLPAGSIDLESQQLRQLTPFHAEGTAELISNTLGEVRIQGQLSVGLEGQCDRCLEPVRIPLDRKYDLFYRPVPEGGPSEQAIDEGESEIGYYEGQGIELDDALREYVLLEIPMQQICQEQCRGICPACGRNRNLGDCRCEVKAADDRWSALRNLKIDTTASG